MRKTKEQLLEMFDLPTGMMTSERIECARILAKQMMDTYQEIIDVIGEDWEHDYYYWANIEKELRDEKL